ncbi:MAG: glycosyltransferase family 4 protein [Candidatus Velthaea sp.]|jgi:glycosyltransferase involved in cell wall biosynthesis
MTALPKHIAILSFEGPDRYSSIGGLGTRVTALARALGAAGHDVQLFFVGDPALKPAEPFAPNVTLRRWCGWISAHHPRNAYDGESEKIADINSSLPGWIVENVVAPAAAAGERVLVLAEEWQMAQATILIDHLLRTRDLRRSATILWNANNTYGFNRIDWHALAAAAAITAVSKYMKFELMKIGVPGLVVPNGIDPGLLNGPDPVYVDEFKKAFGGKPTLLKVGRFDPDKNWLQAIDALAELRKSGVPARLIVRGGKEPYGEVVFGRARELGLMVERMQYEGSDGHRLAAALAYIDAPVVHVRAFLDEPTLCALYAACDVVLANSGKEPFGLVGLEVMAAGGIVVTGSTGEEYAEPFVNAIVCDTADGRELAAYLGALLGNRDLQDELRQEGAATAARYTWAHVLESLERKVAYVDAVYGT